VDRADLGDRAHRVELVGLDLLALVALGDGEDAVLGVAHRGLDRAHGPCPRRHDGEARAGEHHRPTHRQDRKGLRHAYRGGHDETPSQPLHSVRFRARLTDRAVAGAGFRASAGVNIRRAGA